MDFQQSNTFLNVQNAYEKELIACAKYELFGKRATQEVLVEISNIFDTTSTNELFISERLRRIIFDGTPSTLQNLTEASDEELADSSEYREYSRIATEEGYAEIASLFNGIANIKLNHNYTFQSVITEIQSDQLFCKPQEGLWICLGCGNIMGGLCAPEICPVCGYPQGYYELLRLL
jgi:rubrerythrin